jgi:hypothetical protein
LSTSAQTVRVRGKVSAVASTFETFCNEEVVSLRLDVHAIDAKHRVMGLTTAVAVTIAVTVSRLIWERNDHDEVTYFIND